MTALLSRVCYVCIVPDMLTFPSGNLGIVPATRLSSRVLGSAAWLSCLLMAASLSAQDTTGTGRLSGIVTESDGAPSPGVQVCVVDSNRCDQTGAGGIFRLLELRSGSYILEFSRDDVSIQSEVITVRAGVETQVGVTMPTVFAFEETVTVSEPVFLAPDEVKNSGVLVLGEEIWKSAGTFQDVSRYVTSLPGVAGGSADFRNDIIVRGGSPLENLFIVDNIEVPNINNFANFASAGGTSSIVDPILINDVTFLTGGYPAPYINRASSVLQIAQREGKRDGFRSRLTLGFPGVGTVLEGGINKGKGSWLLSARRSFVDLVTDDTGIGGVPAFYSFTGKVVYDLGPRDRIWAVSISGVDDIRLGITEDIDPEESLATLDINYEGWRNASGFNWQHVFDSQSVGLLGITHSEARLNQSVRDISRSGLPLEGTPVDELITASPFVYREDSSEEETTIKYDITAYQSALGKLQAGGSFKIFQPNYSVQSPLGYDGPFTTVPDINPIDLRRRFTAYQSSGYLQSTLNLTSRLNATLGGRVDNYEFINATRFSPRAGVSYRLTDKLSLRSSYGRYYQQPFFLFLSAFPENRDLIPLRSDHYVAGASYVANRTFRFTFEVYRKNYKDYPAATQFPQISFANIGDTFDIRDILYPLASAGRGHSQGVEVFLEKKFSDKWFGQANLAFQRTRHAGLDGILRPGAFDYPVIFNLVGGRRLSKKWELAMRVAYLAGRPYTPFDLALSTQQNRGVFDLSRVNGERAPDFFRWDIRIDRTFTISDKPLIAFFGFQNVTNQQNFNGIQWSRRLNRQSLGDSIGLFPLFGIDWTL